MSYIIGIDEAGRGPLAGPVSVGVLRIKESNLFVLRGVRDSKKLRERSREEWYKWANKARKEKKLNFSVSLVSEKVIDEKGINCAIRLGIKRCLRAVEAQESDRIFLDGGLKASKKFKNQKTIIKGDEKIPVISLASIVAKVTRDRKMVRLGERYPKYDLERHKGYGTKSHVGNIRKYGSTELHRKTYLKRLTK